MAVVYQHRRKDTNEVFYVGIGKEKYRAYRKGRNPHWDRIVDMCGYEVDKKAQIEYYENILSKSLNKMNNEEKSDLGSEINQKTKKLAIAPSSDMTAEEFSKVLSNYAEDYIKSHANEFLVSAQDGSLHWKFEKAASY